MKKFRQISTKYSTKSEFFKFHLNSNDFKYNALTLSLLYFFILFSVILSTYFQKTISQDVMSKAMFFFILFLIVIYLLFIGPLLFTNSAWKRFFVFNEKSLTVMDSDGNNIEQVEFRNIYSVGYNISSQSAVFIYKTNNWRYNKTLHLIGIDYETEFLEITDHIRRESPKLNLLLKKNSFLK